MPSSLLERAYKKAAHRASENTDDNGDVEFDSFYEELLRAFSERLDKSLQREAAWLTELRKTASERGQAAGLEGIRSRFARLPSAPWFHKSMKDAIGQMIERNDPANVPLHALGSIGSALWNRNMVWLGRVPEAPMRPADSPPKLRARNAASISILDHWEKWLGHAYISAIDPEQRNLHHNRQLGDHRRKLLASVLEFRKSLSGLGWNEIEGRLDKLQRQVEVGDEAGGA
jgi:hypothetical protein